MPVAGTGMPLDKPANMSPQQPVAREVRLGIHCDEGRSERHHLLYTRLADDRTRSISLLSSGWRIATVFAPSTWRSCPPATILASERLGCRLYRCRPKTDSQDCLFDRGSPSASAELILAVGSLRGRDDTKRRKQFVNLLECPENT